MSKQPVTSSRFIARLREVSRGTETPMGFGRAPARVGAAILLVVEGTPADADLLAAASRGGADALVVVSDSATDLRSADGLRVTSLDGPIGISTDDGMTDASVADGRPDFVVFRPHAASVSTFEKARAGRVARVAVNFQTGVLRGLVDLPIDAVEISLERPDGSCDGVSVHDLAGLKQVIDSVRLPIVYRSPVGISPVDLKALRDVGLEAVLLSVRDLGVTAESVAARVAEFRSAVVALGGPVGRRHLTDGHRVALPATQGSDSADDDEDDDD